MRKISLLAFLTILVDGFDTTSIGFVVPTLAAQWQLPLSAFTPVFVATSLGAALGYALSGRLAVSLQRRDIVLGSVFLFALGSCLGALAGSVPVLAAIRLLSGIGLGAAIPAVVSLAVEGTAPERRESVTVGVTSGLSLGAALGGAIGGKLILSWGWGSVFLLGGIAPLLLLPALWAHLPADAPAPAGMATAGSAGHPHAARVSALFGAGLAPQTLLLWAFSFLIFTAVYALTFWVPSMLHRLGFDTSGVAFGSAAMGIGGVVAALALIPLSFRFHVRKILLACSLLGAVALVLGWSLAATPGLLLALIVVVGACLIAGTIGQVALAVSLYPPALRTAGIGWSAAIGRLGSVLGPGLMGAFVASELPAPQWLLLPVAPILLAAVALWVAQRMTSRKPVGLGRA
ncbi:MAG: MFS transporter [Curvibacter lanceolatus]|jgi:AAHS family 4-hydroxybenzoate transporter-like MFS transporter|uniref:MFS transporter n=1 Tax=Curvibacter lanceolatus TaxID=86182 RepID=UPI002355AFDD|nr:MFS transporter [Curvibacter lanceolatus]MBV5291412.1 MFS transporter [Curvibacter lanceolatus]